MRRNSLFNNLIKSNKCSTKNKEDVCCINLKHFLVRMFAATLWRNAGNCTFDNLQKCLLNTFTANIACNRCIFTLAGNLINFINKNNSAFCSLDVTVCSVNQLQKNIFYVFTNVAGFCQSCSISHCKWNLKTLCKCAGKKSFSATSWSNQKNVRFFDFYSIFSGLCCSRN